MFGALYGAEGTPTDALVGLAGEFSPRFEVCGRRDVTFDLSGLERMFGDARAIGDALRCTAADRGLRVRVAIAGTCTAARLLARVGSRQTDVVVIESGTEAAALAPLPLHLLTNVSNGSNDPNDSNVSNDPNVFDTLRRWGLRTLGELAALPPDAVAARLGQRGVAWQRLARGDDRRPLVPAVPEERYEQALDLAWPIDGLEPLSFVLGRLMEPLSAQLERRGRGAAVLHVRLHLVKTEDGRRAVHERSLQLPAPMRDARALRTLALLDLESHPPPAAIERVIVAVDPTPGRVLQFSLLARPLPSPEQLSTLTARLTALMGEGRCGSPVEVDSWQPGRFAIKSFAPREASGLEPASDRAGVASGVSRKKPVVALRRFRFPVPARVRVDDGRPSRVVIDRRGFGGGSVGMCAGPWRTSGSWWLLTPLSWDRDEWDVTLQDGVTYRLFRERAADAWFLEGIVD